MTDKRVVIYSTPTCPWCKRAKEYFSQKDIPYLEYNVAENKEAASDMINKTGQMGVPVISINDEVVVGFNQSKLDSLLS